MPPFLFKFLSCTTYVFIITVSKSWSYISSMEKQPKNNLAKIFTYQAAENKRFFPTCDVLKSILKGAVGK